MSDIQQCQPDQERPAKSGPNWEDPSVAVGNAPPMSVWPPVVAIIAWLSGIAFLLKMMMERLG